MEYDRFWLLTWTTYGTWLPGDQRGFVSDIDDPAGGRVRHNKPGTPFDANMPALAASARELLKCEPIRLDHSKAGALRLQFDETAMYRHWCVFAGSVMANHCHLVVGVTADPDPRRILGDFKSYASRALNIKWPKPASGTWWTEGGSKRKLPDHDAALAAVNYVINQEYPLLTWSIAIPELNLPGGLIG